MPQAWVWLYVYCMYAYGYKYVCIHVLCMCGYESVFLNCANTRGSFGESAIICDNSGPFLRQYEAYKILSRLYSCWEAQS